MYKPKTDNLTASGWSAIALAVASLSSISSASTLDEVVVTGSREGTEIRNTPATIHKVTEKELTREKPIFFGEVVNRIPGVYVNNLGAEQHMASIRQPISTQGVYLYLEDGIPVRPAGLFNHNQVYEINMAGIGGIEVIKGPTSSLYGSYATGGLMNFLTKAPSQGFEASVSGQVSDRGYKRADFGISGTSKSGEQAYRLSGYSFDQSNGWARHSDSSKHAFTLRHDSDLGSNRVLKTIVTHTDLYSQMGGGVTQSDWISGRIGNSPQTFTFRDVKATRLVSSLEVGFNQGGLTTFTAFYRNNETNQIPSFYTNPGGTGRTLDQAFQTLGLDVRHRQIIGESGSKITTGLMFDQGSMFGNEKSYTFQTVGGQYVNRSDFTGVVRDYKTAFYNAAIYSQADIVLSPGLTSVIGGRYDSINYDYTRLAAQANQGVPSGTTSYDGFSPKLGLVFSPDSSVSYYANLSSGFAPPEITTRYGGSALGTIAKATTFSKEVGVRKSVWDGRLIWDFALYELDMKNAVYSNESSINYNSDSQIRGTEFGIGFNVNKHLDIFTSLSFTDQKVASAQRNGASGNFTGKFLRYAPQGLGNIQARYSFAEKTSLSIEAQYVSSYFMDEANSVEYKGHTLFNARFSHSDGPLEYWLAARNIANEKYAEFATVSFGRNSYNPGAPRTILAGILYNFGGK